MPTAAAMTTIGITVATAIVVVRLESSELDSVGVGIEDVVELVRVDVDVLDDDVAAEVELGAAELSTSTACGFGA